MELFHVGPGLAVFVVQGESVDFDEIEVVPFDTVAFAVDDLKVTVNVLLAIVKGDLDTLAIRQSTFPEYVFFPIVCADRRYVNLMNFDAGFIMQNKILFSCARKCRGGKKDRNHAKSECDFEFRKRFSHLFNCSFRVLISRESHSEKLTCTLSVVKPPSCTPRRAVRQKNVGKRFSYSLPSERGPG